MLKNHFKIAFRNLNKRKGVALINILGLTLGFGCAILIFLFVNHHLSFDNFHNNSDRIYRAVSEYSTDKTDYFGTVPPGFVKTFKTDYGYAEKVARFVHWGKDMVSVGENKTIRFVEEIAFAQPAFFQIFNFPLLNAKHLDQLAQPNTALLTEKAATKLFGNKNPINQTFVLDNKEVITVKGILKDLPKNSFLTEQIFISFKTMPKYYDFFSSDHWRGILSEFQCFVLLHPNQNVNLINTELKKLAALHHDVCRVRSIKLQPFQSMHLDSTYGGEINTKMLWVLGLIGFFLLLIASINFINISTAQSVYRSKEVGVRKVLGSLKKQLLWQFLTETFLITLFALIFGAILSIIVLPYFNNTFNISLSLTSLLSARFVVFAFILLIGIAILSGSYPGIIMARTKPIMALKGKLSQRDVGGSFTRKTLVTGQFIISMVLIIGTIIIGKQLKYAVNSDLGYNTTAMLMVQLPDGYDWGNLSLFKEKIKQSPNVQQVSACFGSPGASYNDINSNVIYNNKTEEENFTVAVKTADEHYLQTFDLKLVAGRNFFIKDTVDEILVNEIFAKKLEIDNPSELIGKAINLDDEVKGKIVGVIADFHDKDFKKGISPIFIAPVKDSYTEVGIKINLANTKEVLKYVERQWNSIFPNYIFEHSFLDERVAEMYETEQQFLILTRVFSILAIFIGCLGIYGLISFFVAQRTKEIGIRKVLGGTVTDILGLFAKDFFKLVIIAGVIATPLAWYFMNNWLQNFTYRTQINWWIFVLAVASVLIITLLIIGYKGIKAAMANPIKSLRTE